MSNYIILENPKSIASETSLLKGNYYQVFRFEISSKSKFKLNDQIISFKDARKKIDFENYECRVYDLTVAKKSSEFREDHTEFYKGMFVLLLFITSVGLIFNKK